MAGNCDDRVGVSYIEMDKAIDNKVMEEVEKDCNEAIQRATTVTVTVYEMDDPELDKHYEVKTRGLPADHKGPVRLVNINNLDDNLCCGTHVSNLSQLQAVKLLHTDCQKGKVLLHFLVGGRVLDYLAQTVAREKMITATLRNGPEEHLDLIQKMQKSLKMYQKTTQNLLKEVAISEASRLKNSQPKPTYFVCHKKEGDSDFINTFINAVDDNDILLVLTVGDDKSGQPGQLTVSGNEELVGVIGKRLSSILDGKGGGKGSRFNAKINNMKKVNKIEETVREHLQLTAS